MPGLQSFATIRGDRTTIYPPELQSTTLSLRTAFPINWRRPRAERLNIDNPDPEPSPAKGSGLLRRFGDGAAVERMSFGTEDHLLNGTAISAFCELKAFRDSQQRETEF